MIYFNHTKKTWRRWAWNSIALRSQKLKIKNTVAICLAGDIAGDVDEAIKRKITLIGVDHNNNAVLNFRKNGAVAINDSVINQIAYIQPDIAFLDFIGGYSPGINKTANTCNVAAGISKICCFNILRGHDKHGVLEKEKLKKLFTSAGLDVSELEIEKTGSTNRASVAFYNLIYIGMQSTIKDIEIEHGRLNDNELLSVVKQTHDLYIKKCNPMYYSYRSKDGGQYFDSIVFNSESLNVIDTNFDSIKKAVKKESRQKSAAAKAILTIKRNKCKTSH